MNSETTRAVVDIIIALISLASGLGIALVTQRHTDKRHTEDIKADEDKDLNTHMAEMEKRHQSEIEEIKKDYQNNLKTISDRIDRLSDLVLEMKACVQQSQATIELRIDSLEKKTDKHNSVIERTFKLEERASVVEEQIRVANHRLTDLEKVEGK